MKDFDFGTLKALSILEGDVIKIERGNEVLWEKAAEFTNLLPLATDKDRTTILNGVGYKTGYRLSSSSGGESAMSGMCVSGFIPAKVGDVIEIKRITPKSGTASYIMTFNSSNTKVGVQVLAQEGTGWLPNLYYGCIEKYENDTITVTLDSERFGTGFDSFRFSAGVISEDTIVTVNQEIPAEA